MTSPKRQYGYALLAGAVGAGLILLALRAQWAQAVFTPQKPLTAEVVGVSGTDLVPLAEALALAALAGLIAVIATRGVARRAVGVLLAVFGAGAGAAVLTTVSGATVVSVAEGKVASPESAALSGAAGSTTSGTSGSGALVRQQLDRARDHVRRPVAGSGDRRRASHLRGRPGHGPAGPGLAGDVRPLRRAGSPRRGRGRRRGGPRGGPRGPPTRRRCGSR